MSAERVATSRGSELGMLITANTRSPRVWTPPTVYDLGHPDPKVRAQHETELTQRFQDGRLRDVVDNIGEIANGLFEMYNPSLENDERARKTFTDRMLGERHEDRDLGAGIWVGFDWSRELVRYPNPEQYNEALSFRNRYLYTDTEDAHLMSQTVGVAGGSIGRHILNRLLQNRVGGELILADFDHISLSNLNRLPGGSEQLRVGKVDAAAMEISQKNPFINLHLFKEGMNAASLQQIVALNPKLMIDAVDDFPNKARMRLELGEAHGINIAMATDVGESSLVDWELWGDQSQETRLFGNRLTPYEVARMAAESELPAKERHYTNEHKGEFLMRIIGKEHFTPRIEQSLGAIGTYLGGYPQLDSTAELGAVIVTRGARKLLLGGKMRSGREIIHPDNHYEFQPLAA